MTLGQKVARGEISFRKADELLRTRNKTERQPSARFVEHYEKLNWNLIDAMEFSRLTRQSVAKKLKNINVTENDVNALKGALLCKRLEEGMQPLLAVALYKDGK